MMQNTNIQNNKEISTIKNNNKQLIKERLEQIKSSISRISLLEDEQDKYHTESASNKYHSEN